MIPSTFKLESNVPDDLMNYIIPDVEDPEVVENEISTLANVPIEDRGEYSMTIHDQMDDALSLNPESIEVKIGDTVLESQYYMVNTSTTDGCDFEITMDLIALYKAGIITEEDIASATPITVTYTATLKEDAAAGSYENTAWVTYPTGESEKPVVTVDTYGITIFKYDSATNAGLEGAVFELYDSNAEDAEPIRTGITSGADGYVTINGLDEGTYYIKGNPKLPMAMFAVTRNWKSPFPIRLAQTTSSLSTLPTPRSPTPAAWALPCTPLAAG